MGLNRHIFKGKIYTLSTKTSIKKGVPTKITIYTNNAGEEFELNEKGELVKRENKFKLKHKQNFHTINDIDDEYNFITGKYDSKKEFDVFVDWEKIEQNKRIDKKGKEQNWEVNEEYWLDVLLTSIILIIISSLLILIIVKTYKKCKEWFNNWFNNVDHMKKSKTIKSMV